MQYTTKNYTYKNAVVRVHKPILSEWTVIIDEHYPHNG